MLRYASDPQTGQWAPDLVTMVRDRRGAEARDASARNHENNSRAILGRKSGSPLSSNASLRGMSASPLSSKEQAGSRSRDRAQNARDSSFCDLSSDSEKEVLALHFCPCSLAGAALSSINLDNVLFQPVQVGPLLLPCPPPLSSHPSEDYRFHVPHDLCAGVGSEHLHSRPHAGCVAGYEHAVRRVGWHAQLQREICGRWLCATSLAPHLSRLARHRDCHGWWH